MAIFQQLKTYLTDALSQSLAPTMAPVHWFGRKANNAVQWFETAHFSILSIQFSSTVPADLLRWQKSQPYFPQFYFQRRDSGEKLLALGAILQFKDIDHAQQFCLQENLPLVGGVKFHGEPYFFLPQWLLVNDEQQWQLYGFFHKKTLIDWQREGRNFLENLENFAKYSSLPDSVGEWRHGASHAQWCEWVDDACRAIKQGQFTKVVLANETTVQTAQPLDPVDFLHQSIQTHQGCYHFLLRENAERSFLGSSPECLFKRTGKTLQTEALAGTAPVTADQKETAAFGDWLLADPKNCHENQMVVDNIAQSLAPFVENFQVDPLTLKRLRHVQHLRRFIRATLCEANDAPCLHYMHPTAAVAGLPKADAMVFLQNKEENSGVVRGWYAGTLGVMSAQESEFCVAIRSASIDQKGIHIFAGAGIVSGSTPESEWQEIERKATGLLSLLKNNSN